MNDKNDKADKTDKNDVISDLYTVVASRREAHEEGSYTCYLFEKGLDKILKKVGEECAETIIAAKNGNNAELISELSDLIYHMVVLMVERGLPLEAVYGELEERARKMHNLKTFNTVDKNT